MTVNCKIWLCMSAVYKYNYLASAICLPLRGKVAAEG